MGGDEGGDRGWFIQLFFVFGFCCGGNVVVYLYIIL